MNRCQWADHTEVERNYHDREWGVVCYDDQKLFEYLMLELLQSGLSWKIILQKRATLTEAFAGWQPDKVALFGEKQIESLLENLGVIRHRKKIVAIIKNAQAFLAIQAKYGSFSNYIWSFVECPVVQEVTAYELLTNQTALSKKISQHLKNSGFSFLGPVTMYSFMQAIGMVNAHENSCYRKNFEK